jgi:hypothetical protein
MTATEPERWLVADDEVAHKLRPALRMARGGGPSASEHARMWDGLALKLAARGVGGAERVERAQPAASASPAPAAEGGGKLGPAQTALGCHPGWRWIAGTAIFAAAFGYAAALFVAPSERSNARVANPPPAFALSRGSQRVEPPTQASPRPLVSASSIPLVTAADAAVKSLQDARSEPRTAGPRAQRERAEPGARAPNAEQVAGRARERPAAPMLGAQTFRPPQRSAADPGAGTNLTGELDLLARARRVVASNPARALQLTAEHARRFHDGVLAQEREVLAIDALNRLGHRELAAARARRFIASYPDSAHRVRLVAELEAP